MIEYKTVKLSELHEDPANARLHPDENLADIRASLKEFGQVEPLIVHKATGKVIGGNGRLKVMRSLGWEECDVALVDMNDMKATALGIALNRAGERAEWDTKVLAQLMEGLDGLNDELEKSLQELEKEVCVEGEEGGESEENPNDLYTAKIVAPIYEPKGECPPISDLFDHSKTSQLLAEIKSANLPKDVAEFLMLAAERHTSFHFRNIAEFYCHQSAQVQELMEKSGLIIIDFNKAIEYGFVHMTERLGQIADIEEGDSKDAA